MVEENRLIKKENACWLASLGIGKNKKHSVMFKNLKYSHVTTLLKLS